MDSKCMDPWLLPRSVATARPEPAAHVVGAAVGIGGAIERARARARHHADLLAARRDVARAGLRGALVAHLAGLRAVAGDRPEGADALETVVAVAGGEARAPGVAGAGLARVLGVLAAELD